ncbi:MAG: hypothetical protein OER96_02295 [Gammaproteobacteria bacterium]|nr:hypothetical protein [Gammaproteobacteria bacterium]
MHNLIKILIHICLFRAKPQDLPTSQQLAIVSGFMLALIGAFGGNISLDDNISAGTMTIFSFIQVVVLGALIWLILQKKQLAERWYQAVTAMFGTQTLLTLLTMPMINWHLRIAGSLVFDEKLVITIPLLTAGILAVWAYAVAIYIVRITLETTLSSAFFLTIFIFIASNVIALTLTPR